RRSSHSRFALSSGSGPGLSAEKSEWRRPQGRWGERMSQLALTIANDAEELAERAAGRFLQAAGEAISQDRRFTAALAGGSTPEKLYSLLAQPGYAARIDWQRCALLLGDERFVPLDDPHSNYALVRRTLLAPGTVPANQVFPVPVQSATVDAA